MHCGQNMQRKVIKVKGLWVVTEISLGRKKKRETKVSTVSRLVKPVEEEKAAKRAMEEEKVKVIHVARRVGKFFGGLTIAFGIMLIVFSLYMIMSGQTPFPSEMKLLFIVFLALLGVVNTVSGLLLMGRG